MDVEDLTLTPEGYYQKHPNKVTASIHYAEFLAHQGDLKKSIEIYEAAMDSTQLKRKTHLSESYARFAVTHLEYEQGEKVFEKSKKIKDSNELNNIYVDFLLKHSKNSEAEELLLKLIDNPRNTTQLFKLSKLYELQENYKKAIEIYEKLVENNSSNGTAWKLLRATEEKIKLKQNNNTIKKSISFEPQYHSSGLTILQNFGLLLNKKYPNGDVAFTIEQHGLKIVMVIEHPQGHKEIVEDYLNSYGLAVSGAITPEQFLTNPVEVMDLKRQIIQYKADIEWQNEKQRMLEGTIQDRDSQISFFKEQISSVLSNNKSILELTHNTSNILANIARSKDESINTLVAKLITSIDKKDDNSFKEISEKIKEKSPQTMDKVNDFILSSISSISGNAPAWISYISKLL